MSGFNKLEALKNREFLRESPDDFILLCLNQYHGSSFLLKQIKNSQLKTDHTYITIRKIEIVFLFSLLLGLFLIVQKVKLNQSEILVKIVLKDLKSLKFKSRKFIKFSNYISFILEKIYQHA